MNPARYDFHDGLYAYALVEGPVAPAEAVPVPFPRLVLARLADDPFHRLQLRRAFSDVLERSAHTYTDAEILDALVHCLQEGRLLLVEERTRAASSGGGTTPVPGRGTPPGTQPGGPPTPPPGETPLTWFELHVVDEMGEPVGGLDVVFTLGSGPQQRTTDDGGRARVLDVPDRTASVRVADAANVAAALAGRVDRSRDALSLPEGPHVHVRLPSRLDKPVPLEHEAVARLVLVTRMDLAYPVLSTPWQDLMLAEATAQGLLEPGKRTRLQLLADGTRAEVGVIKPPHADADTPVEWLRALVDGLHETLFDADFDAVWSVLETIPLDVPAPEQEIPAPVTEDLALAAILAELALEGKVETPFPPDIEQI